MKQSTAVILVIIAILVVGGIVVYSMQYNSGSVSMYPTSTPVKAVAGENPTPVSKQAGVPMVSTNESGLPTDTTAVLSGIVTPNGSLTNYWYEYGVTPSLGKRTVAQSVGSGYVAIPAPNYITGLTKDTTYYFRLVAQNNFGTVAGTQYSFQTTHGNPAPVGAIPTVKSVAADSVSRTGANLNGVITPNGADTSYWFEYGTTPNLGNTSAFTSAGNGNTRMNGVFSLSGLDSATTYYFRINAQNQFGTVNGAVLSFKTSGPAAAKAPAVSTRSATNVGTSTAVVRGTLSSNGADTTYWFEYSTDSLLSQLLVSATDKVNGGTSLNSSSVSVNLTNLSPNTTFYYRLVAQNSAGTVEGENLSFRTKSK